MLGFASLTAFPWWGPRGVLVRARPESALRSTGSQHAQRERSAVSVVCVVWSVCIPGDGRSSAAALETTNKVWRDLRLGEIRSQIRGQQRAPLDWRVLYDTPVT